MCPPTIRLLTRFALQLFAAGPPVVKQATFEDLSKEALGGWEVHSTNGTIDNVATSELDAFHQIRTFLSYVPSSIFCLPPVIPSSDSRDRREEELISIIPRRRARTYDIRRLIRLVVDVQPGASDVPGADNHSTAFFEIGGTWGRCIVVGFARLEGHAVGVLSSDCTVNGGAIDALSSQKTARFVNLCEHFGCAFLQALIRDILLNCPAVGYPYSTLSINRDSQLVCIRPMTPGLSRRSLRTFIFRIRRGENGDHPAWRLRHVGFVSCHGSYFYCRRQTGIWRCRWGVRGL